MSKSNPSSLRITSQLDQASLSKGQKAFNTLVKKIEASRQLLTQWQSTVETYRHKVNHDYAPLMKTFKSQQMEMVHVLDRALDAYPAGKGLTKAERQVVQDLICELAEALVVDTGDAALKAVYNKYNDMDFDAEELQATQSMKTALEDMFDIDMGNVGNMGDGADATMSPQDLLRKIQEEMAKVHQAGLAREEKLKLRKKTPKQLAREEKQKADAYQTSQSIREVYRKLVSALHPDREPDEQERKRKTALMQRVNQAYDKGDLLLLLELQLELEHIDASTIAGLSEDRLKHYNKVLKEQLAELDQEIIRLQMPLRQMFNMPPYMVLKPSTVVPLLLRDMAALRRDIAQLKKELLVPGDLTRFKLWIKARKLENKRRDADMRDDGFPFF